MQVQRRFSEKMGELLPEWPQVARALVFLGIAPTRDEGEVAVRQVQMRQLLCQLPISSMLSIVTALFLALSLRNKVSSFELATWLVALVSFNLWRYNRTQTLLGDEQRVCAAAAQPWRAMVMAASAALLFSIPSFLWLGVVGFESKVIICIIVTGMMSAGCVMLSGLPVAALLFVVILGGGLINNYHSMGLTALAAMSIVFVAGLIGTTLASA